MLLYYKFWTCGAAPAPGSSQWPGPPRAARRPPPPPPPGTAAAPARRAPCAPARRLR